MSATMEGRRVLVTGGSMGIGREVAGELSRQGARVVLMGRGRKALDTALGGLVGTGHQSLPLDVSDAAAWSAAVGELDRGGPLHGLVTAAGVLGPIGRLDEVVMDEFLVTISINLVGTALALHHALPRLRLTNGRAVTLSGGGGTAPLARYDAYAASKAAVVRLTENVAVDGEVEVNCVAPGFVATRMHAGTLTAGPEAAGADYYRRTQAQLAEGGFPAAEAAALVAFLLSDSAAGISGRLLSAQWDPWREDEFRRRLRNDRSLATLRRIDGQLFTAGTAG